jgi:hypothetical protein
VNPLSACTEEEFFVHQCLPSSLLPPYSTSGEQPRLQAACASRAGSGIGTTVDVLLAGSDNRGHGLFAIVERVINQVLFARAVGLEPYVFVGEYVLADTRSCEHGSVAYFDAARGPNVWEYFFEQPGSYRPGMRSVGGRRVRSVQYVNPEALYSLALPHNHTITYVGGASYDGPRRRKLRGAAHSLLANGSLVRASLRRRADLLFAPWRAASSSVIGLHARGTDKVVARRVPPEAYFPFVDAWVDEHPDALVLVATDDRDYYDRIAARYGVWGVRSSRGGRVVGASQGYRTASVISDSSINAHSKGEDVVIDGMLLSKCDFLLKSASAVAEFAMWVNIDLHDRHIDLQWEDRLKSQSLPPWAASVVRNDAQPYCAALARGCRIDAARGANDRAAASCARCQPRIDPMSKAAAVRAAAMPASVGNGATCTVLHKRGLKHTECIAYARRRGLEFIGVQSEASEFGGCVVWNGRSVEFNTAGLNVGCNVRSKGGECLCTD